MKELEDLDISLLFGSLVLLKEDRDTESSAAVKPEQSAKPAASPEPASERQESENPLHNWDTVLICPLSIKSALERHDSNMRKILRALELESVLDHIFPLEKLKDAAWLEQKQAVWFVGLGTQRQAQFSAFIGPHLFSPDPEQLIDVSDKRAMFEPLREFAPNLRTKS